MSLCSFTENQTSKNLRIHLPSVVLDSSFVCGLFTPRPLPPTRRILSLQNGVRCSTTPSVSPPFPLTSDANTSHSITPLTVMTKTPRKTFFLKRTSPSAGHKILRLIRNWKVHRHGPYPAPAESSPSYLRYILILSFRLRTDTV
jgi:hypothetical protein